MGRQQGPYRPEYPVGTLVEILDHADLVQFRDSWAAHHPLDTEQLAHAGKTARVTRVGFYHGGDELYELQGVPGLWHEVCLRAKAEPVLFADFNNEDPQARLRLNCQGTLDDLRNKQIQLQEGLHVTLSDGELKAPGKVTFSEQERIWVAIIDWKQIVP